MHAAWQAQHGRRALSHAAPAKAEPPCAPRAPGGPPDYDGADRSRRYEKRWSILFVLALQLFHHARVGQRGHVAERASFGDVAQETSHDLPRARLGQIPREHDALGKGKL